MTRFIQLEPSHSLIPWELWGVKSPTDLDRQAGLCTPVLVRRQLRATLGGGVSSHTRLCKNPSEDKGATKTQQESPFSHLPSSREEAAAHPAPPKLARCTVRLRCSLSVSGDRHLPEL